MYARIDQGGPVHTRNLGQGQRRRDAVRSRRVATAPGTWQQPQGGGATALPCSVAPDLFFAERPEEIRQARALCVQCPARGPCLDGALQRAEPWGVWGGELILRGAIIPAKRARGRPRGTSKPGAVPVLRAVPIPVGAPISSGASIRPASPDAVPALR